MKTRSLIPAIVLVFLSALPIAECQSGVPTKQGVAEPIARLRNPRYEKASATSIFGISPTAQFVVAGGPDGKIAVWNIAKRSLTAEWEGHGGAIRALAFSPDGKSLASAGGDKEIRVWDTTNNKLTKSLPRGRGVESFIYSPDGSFLVAADLKGVEIWDLKAERVCAQLTPPFYPAHPRWSFADQHTLSFPTAVNGRAIIQYIDVRTGKETNRILLTREPIDWSALSMSGRWLVQIEEGFVATRLLSKRVERQLNVPGWSKGLGRDELVMSLALSPDERLAVIATSRQRIFIVEVSTGLIRSVFRWPDRPQLQTRFVFSPDGRYLACASEQCSIHLWDLTRRQVDGQLPTIVLKADDLDRLWNDLDVEAGAVVDQAIWTLAAGAPQSLPYLAKKLAPERTNTERLAMLVGNLDDDVFKVRAQAEKELEMNLDEAEAALRKGLAASPSLEARRRIERLLELIDDRWLNKSRIARATEAVDRCGTPEARALLEQLKKEHHQP